MVSHSATASAFPTTGCPAIFIKSLYEPQRISSTLPGLSFHPFSNVQDSSRRQLQGLQHDSEMHINNIIQENWILPQRKHSLSTLHRLIA